MPSLLIPRGLASVPAAGTFPVVAVEANFFTSGLGAGWTDITPYVDTAGGGQIVITRGASRVESPVIRYEAGTCSMPLLNTDRRFDPTNMAGAHVPGGVRGVKPFPPAPGSPTHSSRPSRRFHRPTDAA